MTTRQAIGLALLAALMGGTLGASVYVTVCAGFGGDCRIAMGGPPPAAKVVRAKP